MKPALLYEKVDQGKVKCLVCAHHCVINEGGLGVCRVRKNVKGELFSLNYDKVAATHPDPIEKKPLYHCLPASTSFSIAAMGCNFKCTFCQNHSLSVITAERQIYGKNISPEELVRQALTYDSKTIAYTYSEPTIYFELMLETARIARENGLKNVMVTNGYMSRESFDMMRPYLDAANIDLKAFSEDFYKTYSSARLAPVLETIKRMNESGVWVELTTLLIPGLNDDEAEIKQLIDFIVGVDENIPWHVSRFFPQYKLTDAPITPTGSIFHCLETAKVKGLRYLYGGNISGDEWSHTHCHNCGALLIERAGYYTRMINMTDGQCGNCQTRIPGIWK
jgi:pyruvate formate lyase activating enzyme